MTDDNWLFIGTDRRLLEASNFMTECGENSKHISSNAYTEEVHEVLMEFSPKQIVFPILQFKGSLPPEILRPDATMYVGVASEEWLEPYKNAGLEIVRYLQEEWFIWKNAQLTAEAFVKEYYSKAEQTINGKPFFISGFGKVGKTVAHTLSVLGADITILARSAAQLGEASVFGYWTEPLTDTLPVMRAGGSLVNTIPARWLDLNKSKLDEKPFIFDLASAPGCLKGDFLYEYYTIMPGLPGKHFPVDAGIALAEALRRMQR